MKLPAARVVCVHAMAPSLLPTARAFAAVGEAVIVVNLLDDSLAADVKRTGLDEPMHQRFSKLGEYAAQELHADAILFSCSAFGSCIERVQREIPDLPVLKPNEALQRTVVRRGGKAGVLAMFEPTLPSITQELRALAEASGSELQVVPRYVPGALDAFNAGDDARCAELIAEQAVAVAAEHRDLGTLALAMFSMAYAEIKRLYQPPRCGLK